jgi:hypothetical protein
MRITLNMLERQIAKLEQTRNPTAIPRGVISIRRLRPGPADDGDDDAGLAPGQRIVEDHYEDAEKRGVMIWERITVDPSDIGLCYPRPCWSREAIRTYKEWREEDRRHPGPPTDITWCKGRPPEVQRKRRGSLRSSVAAEEHPNAQNEEEGQDDCTTPTICVDEEGRI